MRHGLAGEREQRESKVLGRLVRRQTESRVMAGLAGRQTPTGLHTEYVRTAAKACTAVVKTA